MSGVSIDLAVTRSALGAAATRAEVLVRSVTDASGPTRVLDWTLEAASLSGG